MDIVLFICIYLFALIGYFGIGIIVYVNFDNYNFNKIDYYFEQFLMKLFYRNNKDNCEIEDGQVWYKTCEWHNGIPKYQNKIYYESELWNSSYAPFDTIFELVCLTFWPIWILINLIINSFNDD